MPAALAPCVGLLSSGRLAGRSAIHARRRADVHGRRRRTRRRARTRAFLTPTSRSATTIHAGDTVKFHWAGVGEPHTIDVRDACQRGGTGVQPPDAGAAAGEQPAEGVPCDRREVAATSSPQGPGDATQSVANPCYHAERQPRDGRLPELAARAARLQRDTAYYNSGWPDSGQNWSIHFSSTTSPGSTASCACCTARTCPGRSRSPRPARRS